MMKATLFYAALLAALATPPCDGLVPYDCQNPPKQQSVRKVHPSQRVAGYVVVMRPAGATAMSPLAFRAHARVRAVAVIHAAGAIAGQTVAIGSHSYTEVANLTAASARALDASAEVIIVQENARVGIDALPYGIDRCDQHDLPLDGVYAPRSSGAGSNVYVADTGIDCTHPGFGGRCGEGWAHPSVGSDPADGHGHGTHVAGTAVGTGVGMAEAATVHAVRVLNAEGSGSTASVIGGIAWSVQHAADNGWVGRSVINMSLGGQSQDALDQAVCDAVAAGMAVVVAAGNSSQPACLSSPARASWAITVAASDRTDSAASFTNNGGCVDIWGPGVEVESFAPGGGRATYSGTSMAAPHVAGAAAGCLALGEAIEHCIIGRSTPDKIRSVGGSPNRLIYVGGD